jgi:biotin carboxyl carrier protein
MHEWSFTKVLTQSMKLQATISEKNYQVTVEERGDQTIATVDGREYLLNVRESNSGDLLILEGSEIYHCLVAENLKRRQTFEVQVGPDSYEISIVDPKRLRSGQAASGHNHGAARITAPMPGKVVRLLVAEGAEIEAGAGVVVVEAMKMQNEMKAPKSGKVLSLNASPGATVNAGDVLAIIE